MAASIAVVPYAKLRLRPVQLFFNRMFQPQTDLPTKRIRLPSSVLQSLLWWTASENLNIGVPFRPQYPTVTLGTNASLLGWGALCSGLCTQGVWNRHESRNHINFLELLAVFKALQSFEDVLCCRVIQITSDNIATVFYLNKQGGTKSPTLARLSMQIWEWCIPRDITLIAVHLAGTDNVEADLLSRHMSKLHEWELDRQTCNRLFQRWSLPDIDLFATQQNRVCETFCSRAGIGQGSSGDAFMIPWNDKTSYAFPPNSPHHESNRKDNSRRGHRTAANSLVATPAMVLDTSLHFSGGIPSTPSHSLSHNSAGGHDPAPGSSVAETASLTNLIAVNVSPVPTPSAVPTDPIPRSDTPFHAVNPSTSSASLDPTNILSASRVLHPDIQYILDSALRPSTQKIIRGEVA
ncbi:uncharacterized protein LOC123024533 isoform X1 [Varanus komodoensis]|uniref:uncharacterized protein LOC123024533 isoform X1 n=1 Tax=Varanus komodoensis TaxID=61221 RepID=UPI001CF76B84|nr:uncharacterized protein LOC123024533 isoform X1 [Varanus komodoensis]